MENIQSQMNPSLMINVIHKDEFHIEKQNQQMESLIKISTHEQFITWLSSIQIEWTSSKEDINLHSVQDLVDSNNI